MTIGHDTARVKLEDRLPPVLLLIGPPSVGKRNLAQHLAKHHGIHKADRLDIGFPHPNPENRLNNERARDVVQFLSRRPFGKYKLVSSRLEHASEDAFNILLKTLEEPPDFARFILIANQATSIPLTVRSRAETHRLGALTVNEVTTILQFQKWPEVKARESAMMSGGQVDAAFRAEDLLNAKGKVVQALRAVAEGNPELLRAALRTVALEDGTTTGWKDEQLKLLRRFTVEARTKRWRDFNSSEAFGLQDKPKILDRMERALRTEAGARLVAKMALTPLVEERKRSGH